jgi:glycosyltransferase involved in cell wall biosynthesis
VPKTVLVVPCYNEARRLDRAELLRLSLARDDLTLLFVDDGSSDGTAAVVGALQEASPRVALHRLPANVGKAEAVRAGLRAALAGGAELVGYADADLATPVDELLRLIDLAGETPAAVVLGARVRLLGTSIERRAARHYLGRVFATVASIILELPVYDTQCGAKLFRRTPTLVAALEAPFRSQWAFDVELLHRIAHGTAGSPPLPVEAFLEIPLRRWRDVSGSKLRPGAMIRAGVDLLALLLRHRVVGRRRPPQPPHD